MKPTHLLATLPDSVKTVLGRIAEKSDAQKLLLFGSRARGDHRENSDFDICVVGRKLSDHDWNLLLVEIEHEALSLYKIDVVEMEKLSAKYVDQIKKDGKVLYE